MKNTSLSSNVTRELLTYVRKIATHPSTMTRNVKQRFARKRGRERKKEKRNRQKIRKRGDERNAEREREIRLATLPSENSCRALRARDAASQSTPLQLPPLPLSPPPPSPPPPLLSRWKLITSKEKLLLLDL